MPIEIRELHIKTGIQKETVGKREHELKIDHNSLKNEIIASCEQLIKKLLKEQKER